MRLSSKHFNPKFPTFVCFTYRFQSTAAEFGFVVMEDMDIDHVVHIPDTPDRSAARNLNAADHAGKESRFSIPRHLRNSKVIEEDYFIQPRGRGRLVDENGQDRRLHTQPRKNVANVVEIDNCPDSISSSPLENSYASRNASLFRRTAIDKNSKHQLRNSSEAAEVDRGKLKCSKLYSKSSTSQHDNDSIEPKGHARIMEVAFPRVKSKEAPNKEIKEGDIVNGGGSLNRLRNCSKTSNNNLNKGKEKVEDNTSRYAHSIVDLGKGLNLSGGSQCKNGKQSSESHHSAVSSRVSGHKRLVRNGCISPHNIEVRTKKLTESPQNCPNDVQQQNHSGSAVPGASCMVDISDIVSENGRHNRSQGVRIRNCCSRGKESESIHLSAGATIDNEVTKNSHAGGDAAGCLEMSGRWRSTHTRSKRGDNTSSGEPVNHLRIADGNRGSQGGRRSSCQHQNVAQTASRPVSSVDQISQSNRAANALTKRQRQRESTTRNTGESSRVVPDDSDIVFIGSSAESSRSIPSRMHSRQFPGVVDVNELSPETQVDDSEARARQLEADEMMALELQEQLYHESPVSGSSRVDENIALLLQREEDEIRNQIRHAYPRLPQRPSRLPQRRLLQNPSNRRGTQARIRSSAGTSQLRSRFLNRSRAFPLDMDIEMRLDILEMLEAAADDLNDVGPTGHILHLQRDFNENDYEMLLALDENNHRDGASATQINNLPMSTVQSDSFDETCAICLDIPTVGDSIRHLPCLHKFHKDCIDPWLSRKSSCPVCKSSLT